MNPRRAFLSLLVPGLLLLGCAARAQISFPAPQSWTVDGVQRQALVYAPSSATTTPAPVLFVFHGHGGTMREMAHFNYQAAWPEAIVVYPQALNTPGGRVDPLGKKPGWQGRPGAQGDRDVKFFDAMLAGLRQQYKVDDQRVYVTGFSSGGGFTYTLWAMRGAVIRAVAPGGASAPDLPSLVPKLKPMPVFVISGLKDPLIKIDWQVATIAALATLNQCGPGQPWTAPDCVYYPSKTGNAVMSYLHPGGHTFPHDAVPLVVKFFQDYAGGNGGASPAATP
jgi:polyhydroxybutyrate depolymerase